MKNIYILLLASFIFTILIPKLGISQYTHLHNFDDTGLTGNANGAYPCGTLMASGNVLYGVTERGGVNGVGNIFSMHTDSTMYKDMYDFNTTSGGNPHGALAFANGHLFGMAANGGVYGDGCVFAINPDGTGYTDLLDLHGTTIPHGAIPEGSLLINKSEMYGMTSSGGAFNYGCVFSLNVLGGNYQDLLSFGNSNGAHPTGDLIISGGLLYGMTQMGGAHDSGCVFSIDTVGTKYKDLLDFNGTNGSTPLGSLTISNGVLYGMTSKGGLNHLGCIFSIDTDGSGYKDLLDFNGTNGAEPEGSLTLVGNILFGMTYSGNNIFSMDTDGSSFNNLYDFTGSDGQYPKGSLLLSTGILYGMTYSGGRNTSGVIFSYNLDGLGVSNLIIKSNVINVYPNPSDGVFAFAFSHPELIASAAANQTIEVYNILGEKIYDATLKQIQGNTTIDISNEPNGIYLYRVIANSSGLIGEGRLIIQK